MLNNEAKAISEFLAANNLSKSETIPFPLKTLPRPIGRATRVMVTEYDLPRKQIQPHDVLLPTDDATLTAISANRADFERLIRLPIPNAPQLAYGLDKARVMQLAEQLGIPHPKTLLPSRADEVADLARDLNAPLVIKPRSSSGGRGIAYLGPGDDVAQTWTQAHAQHPFPMLQECVPAGPKFDVGVLMDARGHAVASFVQQECAIFQFATVSARCK